MSLIWITFRISLVLVWERLRIKIILQHRKKTQFLPFVTPRDGDVSAAIGTGRRGRRWSGYRTCRAAATRCGRSRSGRRQNFSWRIPLRLAGASQRRRRVRMTPEEVARALGMPHPLCRSSTIEAGPLTLGIHQVGLYGRAVNVDVAPGGGNMSIALTSSGSGD